MASSCLKSPKITRARPQTQSGLGGESPPGPVCPWTLSPPPCPARKVVTKANGNGNLSARYLFDRCNDEIHVSFFTADGFGFVSIAHKKIQPRWISGAITLISLEQ